MVEGQVPPPISGDRGRSYSPLYYDMAMVPVQYEGHLSFIVVYEGVENCVFHLNVEDGHDLEFIWGQVKPYFDPFHG